MRAPDSVLALLAIVTTPAVRYYVISSGSCGAWRSYLDHSTSNALFCAISTHYHISFANNSIGPLSTSYSEASRIGIPPYQSSVSVASDRGGQLDMRIQSFSEGAPARGTTIATIETADDPEDEIA